MLFGPAEQVGSGLQFYTGRPGVVAGFTEKLSLKATERRKDCRDATPQKVAAKLRILDARRAAFRTSDGVPQCTVARVPLLEEFSHGRLFFLGNAKTNSGQSGCKEIPLLQIPFVVNFDRDTCFLKPATQGFDLFWFIECRYGQPFHNLPFVLSFGSAEGTPDAVRYTAAKETPAGRGGLISR